MMFSRLLFLIVALSAPFATAENSQPVISAASCETTLSPAETKYIFEDATARIFDQDIPYTFTRDQGRSFSSKAKSDNKTYKVSKIFPKKKPFIVGFNGPHAFIYYNGHLIEARGTAPFYVKSFVKEQEVILANLIFAFKNPPKKFKARFEDLINNFESSIDRTCVNLACKSTNTVWPELGIEVTNNPITLLEQLFLLKAAHPKKIDVILLGKDDLQKQINKVRRGTYETMSFASGHTIAMTGYASMIGLMLFTLLSN